MAVPPLRRWRTPRPSRRWLSRVLSRDVCPVAPEPEIPKLPVSLCGLFLASYLFHFDHLMSPPDHPFFARSSHWCRPLYGGEGSPCPLSSRRRGRRSHFFLWVGTGMCLRRSADLLLDLVGVLVARLPLSAVSPRSRHFRISVASSSRSSSVSLAPASLPQSGSDFLSWVMLDASLSTSS